MSAQSLLDKNKVYGTNKFKDIVGLEFQQEWNYIYFYIVSLFSSKEEI